MDLNIPGLEDVVEIGRGGFATVYRAYQPAFRRTVAIKVLNSDHLDELAQERFRRECQAMGLLSEHPSIVTVLDAGFLDSGRAYMVMPFMPAGSLADKVRSEGPVPWAEASKVAVKLAGALHAAHDAGVIHRDVKPANILISEYGETKLADFGIARVSGGAETASGVVTASLAYAPPELVEGQRPSVQSDVYSLGATIYALLAGHAPVEVGADASVAAVLHRILNEDPSDLVARGVPEPLAAVIRTAMAKDPAARHDSAATFGREVRLAQDELGIKPTELTIVKIATQPPAADADVDPSLMTAAGPGVEDGVETVGVTAARDRDDATREVPVSAGSDTDGRQRDGPSTRIVIAGLVAVVVVIAVAIVALSGSGDEGDGSAGSTGADAPTAADNPRVVSEGYRPPVVDDPLEPPLGADTGIGDALMLAFDHETGRIAQCPDGLVRDLSAEDLTGAQWADRDLRCTDFRGAELAGADLTGATMWASDFTGADLRDVTFGSPGGHPVQLQAAVLVDADLRGLDLANTDWQFTNLQGANLEGASTELIESVVLGGTICPDGSSSDDTNCGLPD